MFSCLLYFAPHCFYNLISALKSSHARLSDDPLLIWKDMCKVYPILSKMAIKYLVPVATSVPSERLFSKAGLTLSKQRNRLTSNHLNQLLFLQSLDDTLWLGQSINNVQSQKIKYIIKKYYTVFLLLLMHQSLIQNKNAQYYIPTQT